MQNNKYGVDNQGNLINTETFEVVQGPTLIVNHKDLKPAPGFPSAKVEETLNEVSEFLEEHYATSVPLGDEQEEG